MSKPSHFYHTPGERPPELEGPIEGIPPKERERILKRIKHLQEVIDKARAKRREKRRNRKP